MTKDEARAIMRVDNDAKLAAALGIGRATVSQWPDEGLPKSAQDKVLAEYARNQLASKAQERGLIDSQGRPNVGRYLALQSYSDVQDACTCRAIAKSKSGENGSAKGMMLQINKKIKDELGHSVPDLASDSDAQDIVAMIRMAVSKILNNANINYEAEDWKEKDSEVKDKVYKTIEGMIKNWRQYSA